jgi:5-methylcytosine-specific restriction endonuclease McrA
MAGSSGSGVSAAQVRRMTEEQLGFCVYCFERRPLTLEHVEPLSRGGAHDLSNAVMACMSCNASKRAKPLLYWLATRGN